MTTHERIIKLCGQHNIAATALEKELGFGRGSIGKMKSGNPSATRLQKVADYFGISISQLLSDENEIEKLTARDERDIAKDLESIRKKLISGENGPASYDGQELSSEASELFLEEIEIALKRLKIINKEKYNPNKNKK